MELLKPSDFNITGQPIPEDVADQIVEYHMTPLNRAMGALEIQMYVSAKSGYRPVWWEKEKGRSGDSRHTYKDGKGASDVTCEDFQDNKGVLLKHLVENTDYTRFAIYNTFIHCDYASQERWVYNSDWVKQYRVDT